MGIVLCHYLQIAPRNQQKNKLKKKWHNPRNPKKTLNELIEQFTKKLDYLRKSQSENETLGETAISNIRKVVVTKNTQIENIVQKIIQIIKHLGHLYFCISNNIKENLSLIHISEPTRPLYISYAVFCLKKKKKKINQTHQPPPINI
eukprot:TRINITY_DN11377_c0_g1_i1.p2 TRINITY_DN11377_c0_g1~~TRINITY_DN11377_c0_g1_i1.p2  ORF type:complete len:147 (+),score=22.90 TRINITY_DN11377_c0_g1_i1:151-591(+)